MYVLCARVLEMVKVLLDCCFEWFKLSDGTVVWENGIPSGCLCFCGVEYR